MNKFISQGHGSVGVAIVSVNWKAGAITCDCLTSLFHLSENDWYAIICENGSPDDSGFLLRQFLKSRFTEVARSESCGIPPVFDYFDNFSQFPRVSLVLSPKNLGFAGGNNLALSAIYPSVNPEFFWFLNNDTEVETDCLSVLKKKMSSDASIGICGATLLYAHQRDCVQALGGAKYWPSTGKLKEIGQGCSWPIAVDESKTELELDYVAGASMFVSADFLKKVGPMSEDYFLYFEELDWAQRARCAGYRLGYASRAIVYHREGAVLGSGKSVMRSALAEYYGVRNRIVVTRKFFPRALPTVYLFSWMQVAKRLLSGKWARARMMAAVLLGLRRSAP